MSIQSAAVTAFLHGDATAEQLAELRGRMLRWINSATETKRDDAGKAIRQATPSLAQSMGLPPSPAKAGILMRNNHLRRAAALLRVTGTNKDPAAGALLQEINRFRGAKWPTWSNQNAPPDYGSDLHKELFWAFWYGSGNVPKSQKMLCIILRDQ